MRVFKLTNMKTQNLHKHVCKISGKGMSQGFLLDGETYRCREDYKEEDTKTFLTEVRKLIPSFNADINAGVSDGYFGEDALGGCLIPKTISDDNLLEYSYEEGYHYFTEWEQEGLEEEGEAYDDEGVKYTFEDGEWVN